MGPDSERNVERLRLRALINCVPDYLFVKDTESRFVVANHAVAADLGLTAEDLIGKTDFQLHSPELASKFFADEQQVIRSETPQIDIEEFVVTNSGQQKWLSTSKLPLRNSENQVIGIVGVSRDVTDRKRAEDALAESESRWNFALEGAGRACGTTIFGTTRHSSRRRGGRCAASSLDEAVDSVARGLAGA